MSVPPVDVLVIGGGPAGIACALALHAHGVRVVVAERRPRGSSGTPGETIPGRARLALEALELSSVLDDPSCTPIYAHRSRWGPALRERSLLQDPYGHGWQIDRDRFDDQLRSRAAARGVEVRMATRCTSVVADAARWQITLEHDRHRTWVHAPFVVDATGGPAFVARRLGARRERCDRTIAVIAGIPRPPGPDANPGTTLVEACPAGWWYSVVRATGDAVVSFLTDAARIPATAAARAALVRDHLRTAPLTERLAGGRELAWLRVVSAGPVATSPTAGEAWLATGDAAAVHDPLSFSGVTKALEHGPATAAGIVAWLAGDRRALARLRARARAEFHQHLQTRRAYYAATGLAQLPFWRARSAPPVRPALPGAGDQAASGL